MSLWRRKRGTRVVAKRASAEPDMLSEARKNVEEKLGIDLNKVAQEAAKGAAEKAVEMTVNAVVNKLRGHS